MYPFRHACGWSCSSVVGGAGCAVDCSLSTVSLRFCGPGPGVCHHLRGHLYVMSLLSHLLWRNAILIRYNSPMKLSRLKEHRERRGLTQMELAKLADVGRATIAAIKTGKRPRPHLPTRERLAKALKVKPEDLV